MILNRKIKIIKDSFISRLRSSVIGEGMLHKGNPYLMDYAIRNMPNNGITLEIGVYGGLSTNLILHLLLKHQKKVDHCGCDAWIYEGYMDGHTKKKQNHIDGKKDVLRTDYMQHIKNSFISSAQVLHGNNLPYTCHLTSDEFFKKWNNKTEFIDVFGRTFSLDKKIAFCYIDGDHSFEQTKRDFENVSQNLLKGGYILIDDSGKHMDFGSARYISEIKKMANFKIVANNPNYLIQKIK